MFLPMPPEDGGAPPSSGGIGRNMWWVNPAW
ncbi:hypothetical protein PICSAR213_03034 [Mycobacterium avium subsp. paratuberculosis]|nr:hypothetical protein PICSAR213_03034 [Mycobacterium avium subsp. paratuberculosis]